MCRMLPWASADIVGVGQHWTLLAVRRCIANIKDECAHDYGGCWRGDFTGNGRTQTYHACHDNIDLYKV